MDVRRARHFFALVHGDVGSGLFHHLLSSRLLKLLQRALDRNLPALAVGRNRLGGRLEKVDRPALVLYETS